MRTLRFVHASDFHLDAPFQGLTAAKAAMRREEQREMLQRFAALGDNVDLILLSGNLFDSSSGGSSSGQELMDALGHARCPVILSPGSRDRFEEHNVWSGLTIPENVSVFRRREMHLITVPSAGARIYGAAFTAASSPALLRGFHAERKAGFYNLLCMQGEVGNPSSSFNPIDEAELAASGTDYAALGNGSAASGLRQSGGCKYAWPGCPEGRNFEEDGEKSVYIVELDPEGCRLEAVNISSRQYRNLSLDITEKDPLLLIHTALPDNTVRDCWRITLTGETDKAPDLRRLHRNLDEMFFSLQLRDRTHLSPAVWAQAGEDTLRGLFLKRLRKQFEAAQTEAEKARIEQAARQGLAALDGGAMHENP